MAKFSARSDLSNRYFLTVRGFRRWTYLTTGNVNVSNSSISVYISKMVYIIKSFKTCSQCYYISIVPKTYHKSISVWKWPSAYSIHYTIVSCTPICSGIQMPIVFGIYHIIWLLLRCHMNININVHIWHFKHEQRCRRTTLIDGP